MRNDFLILIHFFYPSVHYSTLLFRLHKKKIQYIFVPSKTKKKQCVYHSIFVFVSWRGEGGKTIIIIKKIYIDIIYLSFNFKNIKPINTCTIAKSFVCHNIILKTKSILVSDRNVSSKILAGQRNILFLAFFIPFPVRIKVSDSNRRIATEFYFATKL